VRFAEYYIILNLIKCVVVLYIHLELQILALLPGFFFLPAASPTSVRK